MTVTGPAQLSLTPVTRLAFGAGTAEAITYSDRSRASQHRWRHDHLR